MPHGRESEHVQGVAARGRPGLGTWAAGLRKVLNSPSTGRWLAADSLDSHLGGARTLILPGRTGPATRESA
jgi:hypothetical protein